jgi:aryl-alcohol dehydrogenase-like predicted oxidoreductase
MEARVLRAHRATRLEEHDMHTRKLGNSDMHITPIGYGSWAIGGPGWKFGWGPQDDEASVRAILRALEAGINWIDTAAAYGLGHAEEVVATALARWPGARPYVFTKCGLVWDGNGNISRRLARDSVRRECEASLRRLRVDAIDLYQIHWPTGNDVEDEQGWATLAELQREGKVRWIGVSNYNAQHLERAQKIAPITSLQPPYSLIRRGVERDVLPYCERHGIGVIAYSPKGSGLLTGAMTADRVSRLPESDWRRTDPDFQEPLLSRTLALVEKLREIGARHGVSPAEVAIAWTLHHPAVTAAIVGARTAAQVDGIVGAREFRLSPLEIEEIERASAGERASA